jgi:uroporphyrin-III C-methyltransferase/precorrin-2 dehydrogenase/sirohydrochlorin ferrochelatase
MSAASGWCLPCGDPAASCVCCCQRGAGDGCSLRPTSSSSTGSLRASSSPGWTTLARLDGTLVLLMGVSRLREHAASLIAHGRAASTAVAVVERGTTPDQRTTVGTLADIGDLAAARGVRSPAVVVVVVGPVVALAESVVGTYLGSATHPQDGHAVALSAGG